MPRYRLSLCLLTLLALSSIICIGSPWCLGAQAPETRAVTAGVTISYSLPSQRLTFHEPVILTFRVTNDTPQAIRLDLGQDRKEAFSFAVTRPDGVKVQLPRFFATGLTLTGRVSIQPGRSYSQALVLNEFHDFSTTGRYELEGVLTNPVNVGRGASVSMDTGFRMLLDIGPRDELTLTKTCNALASLIEATNAYPEAADAAIALSYINDPVAVPFLRRALFAQKLVESVAVTGLQRIGNESAVQALAEALRHGTGDTPILAKSALIKIRNQTINMRIRQDIERILSQP